MILGEHGRSELESYMIQGEHGRSSRGSNRCEGVSSGPIHQWRMRKKKNVKHINDI